MMFSSWKCIFVQFMENGKEPAVRGPRVGGLPRAFGELNACRSERLTPWGPRNHGMQTRFDVALAMASQAHACQIRKGAEKLVRVALALHHPSSGCGHAGAAVWLHRGSGGRGFAARCARVGGWCRSGLSRSAQRLATGCSRWFSFEPMACRTSKGHKTPW